MQYYEIIEPSLISSLMYFLNKLIITLIIFHKKRNKEKKSLKK